MTPTWRLLLVDGLDNAGAASGVFKRNVKENSNIFHLKTLKTFNRFELKI